MALRTLLRLVLELGCVQGSAGRPGVVACGRRGVPAGPWRLFHHQGECSLLYETLCARCCIRWENAGELAWATHADLTFQPCSESAYYALGWL